MSALATRLRTVFALGLTNIALAASYRIGVKLGLNPVRRLQAPVPKGPFFYNSSQTKPVPAVAVTAWQESALLFSHWPIAVGKQPPDWLANPLSDQRMPAADRNWWEIPDFDPAVGDIKLIWELSRLDWVLAFAQRARLGDADSLQRLNDWLTDWSHQNPPYKGPNWKCGQEASIRIMHLAMAALILGQVREAAQGLRELVQVHLQRIAPTVQYAMAQDNNHGTSEAAAWVIGGSWLEMLGVPDGARWAQAGRHWLENRASRLIGRQGSFSQYSLNYHRVMLDTFCFAEVWRRYLALPSFSAPWLARALAATQWLRHVINDINGDGPNLGANDGARLFQLSDAPYRDHRPSVQLAMTLFAGQRAYGAEGPWSSHLAWLGLLVPKVQAPPPGDYVADDGGFALLRRGAAMVMLRYPRFRFRPSQADALHLDLWLGGDNVLRDAGTYSYNTEPQWINYFGGTASHNTVQFDDRDQMPRISRFLLGDWLHTSIFEPLTQDQSITRFAVGYRDRFGCTHKRSISLDPSSLQVVDEVAGFDRTVVLRWRLAPGEWCLDKAVERPRVTEASGTGLTLTVNANVPIVRCELVEGWESRHYHEKTPLMVLEIEILTPGVMTTEIHWNA
jgi:hypothetical protein